MLSIDLFSCEIAALTRCFLSACGFLELVPAYHSISISSWAEPAASLFGRAACSVMSLDFWGPRPPFLISPTDSLSIRFFPKVLFGVRYSFDSNFKSFRYDLRVECRAFGVIRGVFRFGCSRSVWRMHAGRIWPTAPAFFPKPWQVSSHFWPSSALASFGFVGRPFSITSWNQFELPDCDSVWLLLSIWGALILFVGVCRSSPPTTSIYPWWIRPLPWDPEVSCWVPTLFPWTDLFRLSCSLLCSWPQKSVYACRVKSH